MTLLWVLPVKQHDCIAVISLWSGMLLKLAPQGREIFHQWQIFGKWLISRITLWYHNFDFTLVSLIACWIYANETFVYNPLDINCWSTLDPSAPKILSEKEFRKQECPFWTSWLNERVFLTFLVSGRSANHSNLSVTEFSFVCFFHVVIEWTLPSNFVKLHFTISYSNHFC